MGDFRIETRRLVLREWVEADVPSFHALCTDPEVMRYLGPLQYRSEVVSAVVRQRALQKRLGHCFWPVERKQDGQFLGFCGVQPPPENTPIEGTLEIGWRLRRDCWGQGFAKEAAEASIGWSWANLDVPEIAAITVPANTRSWGLMERLGMRRSPEEDFDHPDLSPGDPLRRHIVYRIKRPQ